MTRQHYAIMVPSITRNEGITIIDMTADIEKPFIEVWEKAEDGANSLGYGALIAMRAVKPAVSSWMPRHLFTQKATQDRAREALGMRRGN